MASLYGCSTIIPRSCDDCPEEELNKIIHDVFVKKGTTITLGKKTGSANAAAFLAAELAGNAFIVRNVSGSKPDPSVKTGKGPGKQFDRTLASEHTITYIDFNYVNNAEFWNAFRKSAQNYDHYYLTDKKVWKSAATRISVTVSDVITDDNTTYIEAMITVKWSQDGNPIPYDIDADALAQCQVLFDYDTVGGFWNGSGSTDVDIVGDEISGDETSNFNIILDAGYPLAEVQILDGELPTGLTLSYSGNTVKITGTPTETGVFTPTIRASNATGVSGEFTVTITIS